MCVILCPDAFNVGRMPAKIGNVASFSIGMNMVFKVTCDAARLMNAPKAFKVCTTCIIQFRVLTVGLYTQVTAHVVPIMEEAAQLEGKRGGLELDGVMERSLFTYERAGMHKDEQGVDLPRAKGNLHMRPLEKLPGTKANMHKGHARECLVTKVRIMPLFLFCFDGATTMAATGVSLRSRTPDPFTTVNKDDMGCFNDVRVLRRGQSITDVAEELSPGCTSRTHPDHWLISYIVDLNRHSMSVCHTRMPLCRRFFLRKVGMRSCRASTVTSTMLRSASAQTIRSSECRL
jgi:hypothetical protein